MIRSCLLQILSLCYLLAKEIIFKFAKDDESYKNVFKEILMKYRED